MNVVTVAYVAVLRDVGAIVAGTDAAEAALVADGGRPRASRIELAFDHARIVRDAVERVRIELEVSGIATAFVGTTFTMAELRAVYEAIWGVQLDAANFRRSVVGEDGWVIPTGRTRPARAPPAAGPPSSTAPAAPGSTAARSIVSRESQRRSRHESGRARSRTGRRRCSASRRCRGPSRGRRGDRPRSRHDGYPVRQRMGAQPTRAVQVLLRHAPPAGTGSPAATSRVSSTASARR